MLVKEVSYRFKGYGAAFRERLTETLDTIGYKPSYADPDVWICPAVKPNIFEYHEYIF